MSKVHQEVTELTEQERELLAEFAYMGYIRAIDHARQMPEGYSPVLWPNLPEADKQLWRLQSISSLATVATLLRNHDWQNRALDVFMREGISNILREMVVNLRKHYEIERAKNEEVAWSYQWKYDSYRYDHHEKKTVELPVFDTLEQP